MSAAKWAVVRAVIAGIFVAAWCVWMPGIAAGPQEHTHDKTATAASTAEELAPDSAYVSPTKYTNAFFGFSMQLPKELRWGTFTVNYGRETIYFLGGALVRRETKPTMVSLVAKKPDGDAEEEAQKFVGRERRQVRVVEIAGKKFWTAEEETIKNGNKMRDLSYATPLNGLVLEIDIVSGDSKLMQEVRRNVEGIQFFDPAKAAEMAGPDSKPLLTPEVQMTKAYERLDQLDMGSVTGNVYKNEDLGFAYEFPAEWIANDKTTRDRAVEAGHKKDYGNELWTAREQEMIRECTRTVFAATKYPVGSEQFENNAARELMYITIVDPACIPDAKFPTSLDDRETLRRIGEGELRVLARLRSAAGVKPALDGFEVQGHLMVQILESIPLRDDLDSGAGKKVLIAHEITQLNGFWVTWTFMAPSEAEIDAMLKTRIKFEDGAAQGAAAQTEQPAGAIKPATATQPKQ